MCIFQTLWRYIRKKSLSKTRFWKKKKYFHFICTDLDPSTNICSENSLIFWTFLLSGSRIRRQFLCCLFLPVPAGSYNTDLSIPPCGHHHYLSQKVTFQSGSWLGISSKKTSRLLMTNVAARKTMKVGTRTTRGK